MPTPRGACCRAGKGGGCCSWGCLRWWLGADSSPVSRGVDRPPWGLSVIPSLCMATWSAATGAVGRGQSEGTTSPGVGVMTSTTRVRPREGRSCAGPMQAADVPVA